MNVNGTLLIIGGSTNARFRRRWSILRLFRWFR